MVSVFKIITLQNLHFAFIYLTGVFSKYISNSTKSYKRITMKWHHLSIQTELSKGLINPPHPLILCYINLFKWFSHKRLEISLREQNGRTFQNTSTFFTHSFSFSGTTAICLESFYSFLIKGFSMLHQVFESDHIQCIQKENAREKVWYNHWLWLYFP